MTILLALGADLKLEDALLFEVLARSVVTLGSSAIEGILRVVGTHALRLHIIHLHTITHTCAEHRRKTGEYEADASEPERGVAAFSSWWRRGFSLEAFGRVSHEKVPGQQ